MPKGRTSAPLVIGVAHQWITHDKVVELVNAGHHVFDLSQCGDLIDQADLLLHPAAWRWDDSMWGYLDGAIKEARRTRRETKKV